MKSKTFSTKSIVLAISLFFYLAATFLPTLLISDTLPELMALASAVQTWLTSTTFLSGYGVSDSFPTWVGIVMALAPLVTVAITTYVAKMNYVAKRKHLIISHVNSK